MKIPNPIYNLHYSISKIIPNLTVLTIKFNKMIFFFNYPLKIACLYRYRWVTNYNLIIAYVYVNFNFVKINSLFKIKYFLKTKAIIYLSFENKQYILSDHSQKKTKYVFIKY